MKNIWPVEELLIYVLVPHTSWCCQQFLNSMMPKFPKCAFILAADFDIGLVTGLALKTVFFVTWCYVTAGVHIGNVKYNFNPRPAGGHILPPSRIFAITLKLRKISPTNFQYLIEYQFDTLSEPFVKFGWEMFKKMTFQWRHVIRFWAKNDRQLHRS